MEFLQWLEQIPFSVWVREAPTAWAYPTVLLLHTAGMALCVGVAAGIDLRILGLAPSVRLSPLEKFFPVLWGGFFVNALTGTILVMQDATSKLLNVDFYVKMVFIALAVVTVRLIRKRVFTNPRVDDGPLSSDAKVLAALSLVFWLGAITAGRLLAYIPSFA
ncbi:MAG TPA: hypothetical protein VFV95_05865 [Vicinamibacterales bacterium]|nr:hypothetical protein [Vicinamibacterales bacterium]